MKRLLIIASAAFLISGCTDYKSQILALQNEKQELISQSIYKDSTITDFVASINEIEQGINTITEKEKLVKSTDGAELQGDAKTRILSDLADIDKLLQENKDKIASLNKKFKGSTFKIAGLEKMIAGLNDQLAVKDSEMVVLNNQIASLNTTVSTLNNQIVDLNKVTADKEKTIEDQTSKLNTAYYTVGTYKDLLAKKVVIKEGGFLGMGKAEQVKKDFDRSVFTTIDITKLSEIPVSGKEVILLTNHPTDSYSLTKDSKKMVTNLVITNAEKFWSASKYLVVQENK